MPEDQNLPPKKVGNTPCPIFILSPSIKKKNLTSNILFNSCICGCICLCMCVLIFTLIYLLLHKIIPMLANLNNAYFLYFFPVSAGFWAWLLWVLAPEMAQFQALIRRKSGCCPQLKSGNLTREVLTSNSLSWLLAGHYSSKAARIGALVSWWILPEFTPSVLP